MRLAKPFFDIGITVRSADRVSAFWQEEVGAVFDHVLEISDTHVQHRYDLLGSVLKINAPGDIPDAPPSGYHELLVARPGLSEPRGLTDPEGNRVRLIPPGYCGVTQIGLILRVRDVAAHERFYREALMLPAADDGSFRAGEGVFIIEQSSTAPGDAAINGPGMRYTTLQVFDVRAEHVRFLAAGGGEGMPIQQLRDVARFAMVRDPDGNWIELSQRASLTGPLDGAG
ncbi:MAG: VOC family protein [Sphingobium sp.]